MSRKFILAIGVALAPATIAWSQAPAPTEKASVVQAPTPAATAPVAKSPLAEAINTQGMAIVGDKAALQRQLIRAQVLLDRRHFSPGVIDGTTGSNLRLALRAFQEAEDLPVNGKLDAVTWERLITSDPAPVIRSYTLVVADVAGPFAAAVEPGDYAEMAKRPSMTWMSVSESIAERAHMDEKLLLAMNPGAKLDAAGTELLVANTVRSELPTVASISVDKKSGALRAMDAGGKLVAAYPATVGSSDMPAPSGSLVVRTVAPAPNYTFDPSRLTFKAKGGKSEKLTIQPGPNNPVGSTWIDLSKDTYGIHGTPHPETIGKAESHGCVRLTNWDAKDLAGAVKAGTKVVFRGRAA